MACRSEPTAPRLRVAVAASVQFVAEDLAKAFRASTGTPVDLVVGSSGKLATQIQQGAPFDVFLAADTSYPNVLFRNGFADTAPILYGYGQLVVWSMDSVLIASELRSTLLDASVGKIGVANPKTAPYGRASMQVLRSLNVNEKLTGRLVFAESISQVNQYVLSGHCLVGLTAQSVVLAPDIRQRGFYRPVPDSLYTPLAQGVVITRHGATEVEETSRRFVAFLQSTEGLAIFKQYGYE